MRVTLTVTLDEAESANIVIVHAMLRGLNVEHSSGDVDGRKWIDIRGAIDEAGLRRIIAILETQNFA